MHKLRDHIVTSWPGLFAAAERLAQARSLDDVVDVVRTTARNIIGAQGITFVTAEGDHCHYVAEDAISPLWAGQRFPLTRCISGWVMLHGEAAVIPDIYADPRIPHDAYRPTFVKSLVMMPVDTGVTEAAIGAYWEETDAPDDFALDLLEQLARLVAAAIRNVSLQTSFEIVNQTGAAIAADQDLERIVQTVTDAGVELTGAEFGAFFYKGVAEDGESRLLYRFSGGERDVLAGLPMPRNIAVFATAFGGEGIVRPDDPRHGPRFGQVVSRDDGGLLPMASYLVVPVISRSGKMHGGLLFGHRKPGRFSAEHEKILAGIAGHAATAIDNARLHERARREIAARSEVEAQLRQLNGTLEQRIAARTAEIQRAFDALKESEQRFGILVQGVTDYAICMLDAYGIVTNWNVGAERIKGYTAEEIVGRHFSTFYREADREAGMPARTLQVAAVSGRFEAEGWRVRRGGSEYWASVVVDAIHDDQGRLIGFAKVTRDLTEKRAIEDQLRQAQKMEAVGQLTGGIAHDFNNLLTVISGNIELAERALQKEADAGASTGAGAEKARRAVANAMQGAERAAALTQRLLAFSRRQPLSPKPLDLGRMVADLSELLQRSLGELIRLETVTQPGLWAVEADPNQIENALLNLAVNARDAMPGGGTLTIRTGNVHLDQAYVARHPYVTAGDHVLVAVTDTGVGMSAATLGKIFEPFFTTKDIGRGTGLGLSQVYGFVKQSGGHVEVQSQEGQGTTVQLYLPRFAGEAAALGGGGRRGDARGDARGETILVVEDDEGVRAYSAEILRELGYDVLEAADGAAALALVEQPGRAIDLLFTDVVMPGMSGGELSEKARALRPDLRVLFTSGYTRDGLLRGGRLESGIALLPKPFTLSDLAGRIRDLLDQPRASE